MSSLKQLLKHADPVEREAPLQDDDARLLRRAVIAAAEHEQPAGFAWRSLVLAGVAAFAVVLAAVAAVSRQPATPAATAISGDVTEPAVRQMQFSTPGGTRVIWVFNSKFQQ